MLLNQVWKYIPKQTFINSQLEFYAIICVSVLFFVPPNSRGGCCHPGLPSSYSSAKFDTLSPRKKFDLIISVKPWPTWKHADLRKLGMTLRPRLPPWWKKTFNIAAALRSSPICVESGLATVQMMVLRGPNSGLSNLSWGRRLSSLKGTQIQLSHYWAPRTCSFQGKITKNRGWTGRFLAIFNDTMIIFGTTRFLLSNSTFHVTWGTSMTSTSHFFSTLTSP